jgi:NADP-dependent 3-hydroxy acid dehydrogenase YdfG
MFAVPDAVTPMIPAFAAIGALCVAATALSFFNVIYKTCLRGGKNLKKCYGEWAVVTGATDGIGKAMAFELARKGMSVLLVGRSKEKLKAVREELSAKHPHVQVTTEVVDFASFSKKDCARMMGVLDKLEVGVLVNNVGISYAFPQWFHELTEDEIQSLLTVNIESVVWMTRAVMPQMLKRKRGAVVNMSSASARPPNPLLTVYSSTKGFVENFTKSLAIEHQLPVPEPALRRDLDRLPQLQGRSRQACLHRHADDEDVRAVRGGAHRVRHDGLAVLGARDCGVAHRAPRRDSSRQGRPRHAQGRPLPQEECRAHGAKEAVEWAPRDAVPKTRKDLRYGRETRDHRTGPAVGTRHRDSAPTPAVRPHQRG